MFHCEASLLEDVDDVAVDDARHFFFFFYTTNSITLEKNDASKRICIQSGEK